MPEGVPEQPTQSERKAVAKTKRRIEITVDRSRLIVLKRRNGPGSQWCAVCCERVAMLTTDEAATIANVTSRTIYRWADAEKLHFMETAEGVLMICCTSLQDSI
jgi:excisionase family DNA binding protein